MLDLSSHSAVLWQTLILTHYFGGIYSFYLHEAAEQLFKEMWHI